MCVLGRESEKKIERREAEVEKSVHGMVLFVPLPIISSRSLPLSSRIIQLLKRWLEHHFHDFDGELTQQFQQFIASSPQDSELLLLKKVLEVSQKKVRKFFCERV